MVHEGEKAQALSASAREIALLAVGFGCLVAYARMASLGFVGYLSEGVAESFDAWYALRSVASLAVIAVLSLSGFFQWFKIGAKTMAAATVAAAAAAVVFVVDAGSTLGAVVAVLGGCSSAVLLYVWMLLLSAYDAKTVVIATLAGLPLAGAAIMGVPYVDPIAGLVIIVIATIATGACALALDHQLVACSPDGRLDEDEAARVPWITFVMVLGCGFFATLLYGIAERLTWLYAWTPNYPVFGVAAIAVVAVTATLIVRYENWTHSVWIPLFVVLVLALTFSCISLRESIQVAVGLMLAAVFCAHFLHWMIFPALFSTLRIPRVFLAGIVLFVANGSFGTMAGDALGAALPHSVQNLGGVAGLMVLALAALVIVTFLVYRKMYDAAGFLGGATAPASSETAGGDESQSSVDPLKERLDRYADEFGLTPREVEVALFTVQGFSSAYIAEKLVVSVSTVRFHQQNLYRKFDVHSRNELIELVTSAE